jgi:site-specific recombinase XerD
MDDSLVSGQAVVKDRHYFNAVELIANLDLDAAKRGREIALLKVDFEGEVTHWLNIQVSDSTRTKYQHSIKLFLDWCSGNGVDPRFIDRAMAEKYAIYLKEECFRRGLSNSYFNIGIKTARSLYTHLTANVGEGLLFKNHFLKLKIKMPPKVRTIPRVATDPEVETLIRETDPKTSLAIRIMASMGLRVGALECLEVFPNGDGTWDYITVSKGKEIGGPVPLDLVETIKEKEKEGFAGGGFKGERQAPKINWMGGKVFDTWGTYDTERTKKAIKKIKIKHGFDFTSLCHSLRYYSAVKLYRETKDIMAVKDLLNHSSVETTCGYLKRGNALRKLEKFSRTPAPAERIIIR